MISHCALLAAAESPDFVRDVRPILQKHCYSCHAAEKQKSGYRLDIKAAAFRGGELYGASLKPGDLAASPLFQFIADPNADLQMPPDGERLSTAEIETLKRWIEGGANWPDGVDLATLEDRTDHWSFHPVKRAELPSVGQTAWPRNEIDHFILSRLEAAGLEPSAETDRVSWLRRVYLNLIGLPPTPEQVAAFVDDTRPDAYARVVDELLQSPRYGERWAQHWLDVVRYADTHGFEVNTERPNAWPYRDYVIRALNNDTPYDRFIREQIVGDALGVDAATGFLITASVLLPGQIGKDEPSKRLARQDSIDEIVVNVGQTFLGLSVGCARCHDHKFDPISQRDYYAMQALVAGVEYEERVPDTPEVRAIREAAATDQKRLAVVDAELAQYVPLAGSGATRPMINARQNVDRFAPREAQRLKLTILATNNLEPCIDELEIFNTSGENIALASRGAKVTSSGDNVSPNRHELRFLNDGEYGNSRSWMSNEMGRGWVTVELAEPQMIQRVHWGRDRQGKFTDRLAIDYRLEVSSSDGSWHDVATAADREPYAPNAPKSQVTTLEGLTDEERSIAAPLLAERELLQKQIQAAEQLPRYFAGQFRTPDDIHLLSRGDPEQPKERAIPAVLSTFGTVNLTSEAGDRERRVALADWIANPGHPLTARVMVNRIWQGHFGVGLVETASDFGRSGMPASHPELHDWLADEFVQSGWSIKELHRRIVLSATYRQSSAYRETPAQQDADVRLLWRFPPRRLDAEILRDSMLATSGQLDLTMYGRGFDLFNQRGGLSGFTPVEHFTGQGLRRMIYAHKVRRERDAVFGAFDCPDAGQSTARRRESTTPLQALNLLNSGFTLDCAAALQSRVIREVGADPADQIRRAYQLVLNRDPVDEELADCLVVVQEHDLTVLCRALYNSNEALFLP
ncbi:DUF1553 domain-containing protein [bacterium]|nr:DUF1553 domain-containing protein [bacterium]